MPKQAVKRYTKPCKHTHVSGRKCMLRVGRLPMTGQFAETPLCPLHTDECKECQSMMATFTPPKGWHLQ